jgi:CRISPR-associated protein (TIGR02584 family)
VSEPHEYPRRVLAMAVGLTPQVVTETLHALAVSRQPAWVPTEIRLLTTAEGAMRARLMLLDDETGHFHRLCADFGLQGRVRFGSDDITVVEAGGHALHDIRTPAENALAADAITAFVRELCADERAAVHVSIAGGRKSMGYYIGYALSLFGREQDRLSHVLVNDPFESLPDFFYPPARPRVVFGAGNRPASTADARVELAEIPFVRLRAGLPAALLSGAASFGATVEAASRRFGPARLRFDAATSSVQAGPTTVTLPPALWAWYALLADARRRGIGEGGMVRRAELEPRRLLALYGRVAGAMSAAAVRLEAQLRREGGIDEQFFRERNAKLNRLLSDRLGLEAAPYLVQSRGRRPRTRSGIVVDAVHLELPDD